MNNKKTIKTILFASLIAAMILPFSGMNTATAQTNIDDKKYWLQLHKAKIFDTLSEAEQGQYVKNMQNYLDNRTVGQIELDRHVEILSKIVIDDMEKVMILMKIQLSLHNLLEFNLSKEFN